MAAKNGTKPTPAATPQVPDGTLRLLKVLVQPVYVLDTADGLIEVVGDSVWVNGTGWAAWAPQQFTPEELEATRATIQPVSPTGAGPRG